MNVDEFGKALIETGDLDPVYIAIYGAKMPKPQLAKLLLAYFCFYHLGASAYLSEQEAFYEACEAAARNTAPSPKLSRWPRGVERRHFRGEPSIRAVRFLSKKAPEAWIAALGDSFESIKREVESWPLFGPWISYKAADLMERCWGLKFEFPKDVCLLYDEPRKGLLMLNPEKPEQELDRLLRVFGQYRAPPAYDRACNVQEVETVLCKNRASRNGHYFVGKDIHEIRHGLEGWGDTASTLLRCSPKEYEPSTGLFGFGLAS